MEDKRLFLYTHIFFSSNYSPVNLTSDIYIAQSIEQARSGISAEMQAAMKKRGLEWHIEDMSLVEVESQALMDVVHGMADDDQAGLHLYSVNRFALVYPAGVDRSTIMETLAADSPESQVVGHVMTEPLLRSSPHMPEDAMAYFAGTIDNRDFIEIDESRFFAAVIQPILLQKAALYFTLSYAFFTGHDFEHLGEMRPQ